MNNDDIENIPTIRGSSGSRDGSEYKVQSSESAGPVNSLSYFDTNTGVTIAPIGRVAVSGFQVGDEIMDRYVVEGELGRGGMGVVYRCLDRIGKIEVALKALPPELSRDESAMEDIRDNFAIVERLTHSNIAGVRQIEFDRGSETYYLIMELVRGTTLRNYMRRKRRAGDVITVEEIAPLLRQVASALDYAHSKRGLHRDVKPENIMIDEERDVKLLDFRLSDKIRTSMSRVSRVSYEASGTGPYMSPEQWKAQRQGPASDQYALAVIAYEALSGELPFESGNIDILKKAILENDPLPIDDISSTAQKAISRAMSKDFRDRFSSCSEFVAAITSEQYAGAGNTVEIRLNAEQERMLAERRVRVEPERRPEPVKRIEQLRPVYDGTRTDVTELVVNGVKFEMVPIKAGSFMMGSPEDEEGRVNDEILHHVSLTKDFYIGKYEVTQEQWQAVMGNDIPFSSVLKRITGDSTPLSTALGNLFRNINAGTCNPSFFKGVKQPVERVSWDDAQGFIKKLNEQADVARSGMRFRLPTEAEWEYACRAGTNTPFSWGSTLNGDKANCDGSYPYNTSAKGVHLQQTSDVGSYPPNAWGLHDMHGNVYEWCEDWYGSYDTNGVTNPKGPTSGHLRVLRGGGWSSYARSCRSANRLGFKQSDMCDYVGFRLVCDALRITN